MRVIVFLFSFLSACTLWGQDANRLVFQMRYFDKQVQLDDTLVLNDGTWFVVSDLKLYMSQIGMAGHKATWDDSTKTHLIDFSETETFTLSTIKGDFTELHFLIGTDSLTNTSNEFLGDLDPILGMYWAWNSGYINFKLEGKAEKSTEKKNAVEFHLGGYLPPYQTVQECSIKIKPNQSEYIIGVQLDQFLAQINLSAEARVMTPGMRASILAKSLPTLFQILP